MKQDKRRWWQRLLILLSGPAIMVIGLLTLMLVFEGGSGHPTQPWEEDVSDAFVYYIDSYFIPVDSTREVGPSCDEAAAFADVRQGCERFVRALTERRDELDRAADRFESLAGTAPSRIPDDWKQALYDTSGILRSIREADALLIAAWSEHDEEKWHLGWQRRAEAREVLRNLSRQLFEYTS